MPLEIHEYANIFPPMSAQEYADLLKDIATNGQREPIWIHEGAIVDGRHRYRACQEIGFPPIVREWDRLGSLLDFVISLNLHRRHMSESQRAMVGATLKPMYEVEARARQRGGQGGSLLPANLPEARGEARAQAAAAVNVSPRSVESASRVLEKGAPELVAAVRAGDVAVSTAAVLTALPAAEQTEVVARGEREIMAMARQIRAGKNETRRQERVQKIAEIATGNQDLEPDERRYPVIYADPPWRYEFSSDDADMIENHYPTMALSEICALPVEDMATPDAILFLWATSPKLEEAMSVLNSWGFTYRTCAIWDKQHIGMGYYFRQQHELLLVATRGSMPVPAPSNRPASVVSEKKGGHSAKPAAFAEMIERMYPELPKLEMFCRAPRDGWRVWGNQAHA